VLTLAVLIMVGGLFPQPGVESRHQAARQLLKLRAALNPGENDGDPSESDLLTEEAESAPEPGDRTSLVDPKEPRKGGEAAE
jgi:hypothetical protein